MVFALAEDGYGGTGHSSVPFRFIGEIDERSDDMKKSNSKSRVTTGQSRSKRGKVRVFVLVLHLFSDLWRSLTNLKGEKFRRNLTGYGMIAPIIIGAMVFYIVPFGIVLKYSVTLGYGGNSSFVWLEHYQKMLENDMFKLAFGNTLRFLVIALPAIMLLAYLIALFLKNNAGKYKLVKSVFLLPYIMPVAGTVLLIDLLFDSSGVMNDLLTLLGVPTMDWIGSGYAFWIVLLLYLWKNTGYSIILLLAGLVTIPEELYEAAELDGASGFQKFLYITTPQMWYTVFMTIVFSVINAFKCFREIFLVGGEHPHESIYMLQHFINNSFANLNYARLAVASVSFFVIIVTVFAALYA